MPTDAFEMALVHQAFCNELHNAPDLIRDVNGRTPIGLRSSAGTSTSSRRRCTITTRPRTK